MYVRTDLHTASIKIFHQNDWVWLTIALNKQDVKYIQTHCAYKKECVPTLKKEGKCWYLVFPFEENVTFQKVGIEQQILCAVDLGIVEHQAHREGIRISRVCAWKTISL